MPILNERSRQVLRATAEALSTEPKVFNYYDEDESHRVAIMHSADFPNPGQTTYATVTLNEYPNDMGGKEIPVEIFGVVHGESEDFAGALSTCAFNLIKDGWLIAPGVVHPGVLAMYSDLAPQLPHMLFTFPMDAGELARIETSAGDVHALQVMPISDSERHYLMDYGFDSLQEVFIRQHVDYTDLGRHSVG